MTNRTRHRFDDDEPSPTHRTPAPTPPDDEPPQPNWSTYADALHGPEPAPSWVITSPAAIDTDLGVFKSGKEADVSLRRRWLGDTSTLMAVKSFRPPEHRLFHRDAGYLEGRRMKESRMTRAMANRTRFGMELIAGQWAVTEFDVLGCFWAAGASVPYPVQLDGTELTMEFIGSGDGVAAPRLAATRPSHNEARDLYEQLVDTLLIIAEAGFAHGDLSAYNVLVDDGRLVVIDLPQAVDIVGNPQGIDYLRRDCENICSWFLARGVDADSVALIARLLRSAGR